MNLEKKIHFLPIPTFFFIYIFGGGGNVQVSEPNVENWDHQYFIKHYFSFLSYFLRLKTTENSARNRHHKNGEKLKVSRLRMGPSTRHTTLWRHKLVTIT